MQILRWTLGLTVGENTSVDTNFINDSLFMNNFQVIMIFTLISNFVTARVSILKTQVKRINARMTVFNSSLTFNLCPFHIKCSQSKALDLFHSTFSLYGNVSHNKPYGSCKGKDIVLHMEPFKTFLAHFPTSRFFPSNPWNVLLLA